MVVLDASTAIRILESPSKQASLILEFEEIISPELYLYEVGNICWKFHQFSDWPLKQCQQFYLKAQALTDIVELTTKSYLRVLEAATELGLSYYDTSYLYPALENQATLFSADKKLISKAKELEVDHVFFASA